MPGSTSSLWWTHFGGSSTIRSCAPGCGVAQQLERVAVHGASSFGLFAAGVVARLRDHRLVEVGGDDLGGAADHRVHREAAAVAAQVEHRAALGELAHEPAVVALVGEEARLVAGAGLHRVEEAVLAHASSRPARHAAACPCLRARPSPCPAAARACCRGTGAAASSPSALELRAACRARRPARRTRCRACRARAREAVALGVHAGGTRRCSCGRPSASSRSTPPAQRLGEVRRARRRPLRRRTCAARAPRAGCRSPCRRDARRGRARSRRCRPAAAAPASGSSCGRTTDGGRARAPSAAAPADSPGASRAAA